MRAITFQSDDVIEYIITHDVYYADPNKMREWNLYQEDAKNVECLPGTNPVWVFELIDNPREELIGRWADELGLDMDIKLHGWHAVEIDIPDNVIVKTGKAHNSYKYAKVVNRIERDWLVALFEFDDSEVFCKYDPYIEYTYCVRKLKTFNNKDSVWMPYADKREDGIGWYRLGVRQAERKYWLEIPKNQVKTYNTFKERLTRISKEYIKLYPGNRIGIEKLINSKKRIEERKLKEKQSINNTTSIIWGRH